MEDLNAGSWNKRYDANDIPWDLKSATPELIALIKSGRLPHRGMAIVPGCGSGFDAIALAQSGLDTAIVEFSPLALNQALDNARKAEITLNAFCLDFFTLPDHAYHKGAYDLFYEYTFFCAIDPKRRKEYVQVAAKLLKPGGILAGIFFPLQTDKPGPPFLVNQQEIEEIFAPYFELELKPAMHSIGPRAGRELLGLFRRKA